MTSNILTTKEAATYCRLGKPTLERFRISGYGPRYCKLGSSVRYRLSDLACLIHEAFGPGSDSLV
jgi:hypothetical protein